MTLQRTERIYTGRVINLDRDTVQLPGGSTGVFEMIRHPGAAAVLPFLDPPHGPDPRVRLIRQYRHAAGGYIWEIPAGRRDGDEDPAHCAARELAEEAGLAAAHLDHLTTLLTTPGFTDERIHLYAAHGVSPVPTAREPDEFMTLHDLRWSEVARMITAGEIGDAKTLVTLLFVQAFYLKY